MRRAAHGGLGCDAWELGDSLHEIALLGPRERIADRLEEWRESGITTMIMGAAQPEALRLMAELVL